MPGAEETERVCGTCGHRISIEESVCPLCGNVFRKEDDDWEWRLIPRKKGNSEV